MATLRPLYVSTVGSGNLLACYLTLGEGIAELIEQPLFSRTQFDGAMTSLRWLDQRIRAEQQQGEQGKPMQALCARCLQLVADLQSTIVWGNGDFVSLRNFLNSIQSATQELQTVAGQLESTTSQQALSLKDSMAVVFKRFRGLLDDARQFMPWLDSVARAEEVRTSHKTRTSTTDMATQVLDVVNPQSSLRELAQLQNVWTIKKRSLPASTQFQSPADLTLDQQIAASANLTATVVERLLTIKSQCEGAGMKMDFHFLYNSQRKLMSIGFNSDVGKLDRGHYDLLCSECRLSSFLAIAKGDVETEHWYRLGRQATVINGKYTLLSWGGTMFEFLMPQLFQKSYAGSLIFESCETAIERQMEYGRQQAKPWGISESAFSAISANTDYQYKSFGVPGLGLKRGLSRDLVIS